MEKCLYLQLWIDWLLYLFSNFDKKKNIFLTKMWSKIILEASTFKSIKINKTKINNKNSQQVKPGHKSKIKKANP